MNFLNKMERRFGRYALTNLSLYIEIEEPRLNSSHYQQSRMPSSA